MPAIRAKITALGCYVPPRVLTNADLEKLVETNDEWILTRTGISERHIADPDVATSDLATCAAKIALDQRGINASELDAIIVCTVTPDMLFPSTVCLVQKNLGASKAWGFDLIAACSGFVYGLTTGSSFIAAGTHKKVLVIGADTMSRIINYEDRTTCVIFGDGAGAMLVEPVEEGCGDVGFIDFYGEVDGSGAPYLNMPAGGSRLPASAETVANKLHYVHQEGQQVFKYAVTKMHEVATTLLARNGLKPTDIDIFIPHQANKRIISATADKLGLPAEKVMTNINRYGNTTAGTIPLATRDAISEGRLKKGDLVLYAAVGAGYTVGASLWRWAYYKDSIAGMPELARFFGIVIRMYFNDHEPAHFHAVYGEHEALIEIETLVILRGELPRRAMALALEWAAVHREELRWDWAQARQGTPLRAIAPLE